MTASVAQYTVSEKILLAAFELDADGNSPFSAESLIVHSWKLFPRTFGLKGYAESYPDSNKVLTSIMGERGLARKGWLIKMGQKLYALTRDGKRMVARLKGEEEPDLEHRLTLPPEDDRFLLQLLNSTAYQKFESNQKNDLAFADACRFWDITQNLKGDALDDRLTSIDRKFNDLEQLLSQEDGELVSGKVVSAGDVRVLRNLHSFMQDRFESVLKLLRSRSTRR